MTLTKAKLLLVASYAFYSIALATALYGSLKAFHFPEGATPLRYHILWIGGVVSMLAWTYTGNAAAWRNYRETKRRDALRKKLG